MELKEYKIQAYAYLVKTGVIDLEPIEGSDKDYVEEAYRTAVAQVLIE